MKVKDLLRLPVKEQQEQNTPLLCLPKTRIGLEYEWENTDRFPFQSSPPVSDYRNSIVNAVKGYFAFHQDGSLRENGMEFTFKEPYAGTRILSAVDCMDAVARAYSFTHSYRTSLHVHLDMSDCSYPADAHRLAALYSLVEPVLYKFVGSNRDGCNYCIPWYANPHHYLQYARLVKPYINKLVDMNSELGIKLGHDLHTNKAYHKYAGMNMMSLGQFGTVEFRQAPVNMQKEKILLWLNILMRLKKDVVEGSWEPNDLIKRVKHHGPTDFMQIVFGSEAPVLLKSTRDIEKDLKMGSLTLFHFATAVQ